MIIVATGVEQEYGGSWKPATTDPDPTAPDPDTPAERDRRRGEGRESTKL